MIRGGAILVGAALGAGCAPSDGMFQPLRARTMQEAGSVHLSVLSVAPWSEFAAALQPSFELTADAALAQVAADSRWMIQDAARTLRLGHEPVILGSSNGVNQVFAPPNHGQGSGGWPEGYNRIGDGKVAPSRVPPGPDGATPATGPDAMLMYTAATALFQEVQLLNRYIQSAAIPNGFRPYVVRLQVSLMPSRRHAPYDAYTTISFFNRAALTGGGAVASIGDSPFGNGPKILPLLVTDNLEASVNSRSADQVLSLYMGWLNFPDESFVEPLYEALLRDTLRNEVYGRDLNSLLTLARISENTVRIRLGAVQETTANYAMVPRNHNITLLVMVPEAAPPLMEVISKTELVDTTTGETLGGSTDAMTADFVARLRREWGLRSVASETIGELVDLAQRNDHQRFMTRLGATLPAEHPLWVRVQAFWIELVSFAVGSEYSSHLFELPGQQDDADLSSAVFHAQTVVAEDDGSATRIVLREARVPAFEQIIGVLSIGASGHDAEDGDGSSAGEAGDAGDGERSAPAPADRGATRPALVLPARAVQVDGARRELRLEFASLTRLSLLDQDVDGAAPLSLRLSWRGQALQFPVLHREVEPPEDAQR